SRDLSAVPTRRSSDLRVRPRCRMLRLSTGLALRSRLGLRSRLNRVTGLALLAGLAGLPGVSRLRLRSDLAGGRGDGRSRLGGGRSEEHTSELQSRFDL